MPARERRPELEAALRALPWGINKTIRGVRALPALLNLLTVAEARYHAPDTVTDGGFLRAITEAKEALSDHAK